MWANLLVESWQGSWTWKPFCTFLLFALDAICLVMPSGEGLGTSHPLCSQMLNGYLSVMASIACPPGRIWGNLGDKSLSMSGERTCKLC